MVSGKRAGFAPEQVEPFGQFTTLGISWRLPGASNAKECSRRESYALQWFGKASISGGVQSAIAFPIIKVWFSFQGR